MQKQDTNLLDLISTQYPSVFDVLLKLEFKTKSIGKLDLNGKGCFSTKRKPKHIYRNSNAWGVNAELVERFNFRWISIICEDKEYITSKEFLQRFGKCHAFKDAEPQYFLPLELWGLDAVREFEKKQAIKPEQLSLFQSSEAA
jgi:hypothetical protein